MAPGRRCRRRDGQRQGRHHGRLSYRRDADEARRDRVVAVAFAITAAYNRLRILTSTISCSSAVVGQIGASVGVHWRTIATLAEIWVAAQSSPRCSGSPAGRRWAA
jgi:hypothetical protein